MQACLPGDVAMVEKMLTGQEEADTEVETEQRP